ncbi:MAG TPA: AAA family ATPase [Streptosporangiaceae bacterium]|nr:AAA family ATPase [Streptosporangiaceae bacterium]
MTANPSWITRFGFRRAPFGKDIPAADLFNRPSHEEAVARVLFCVQERLLGVIVGEVGVGKTVALRAAVAQLDPTSHQVIYLSNPPALGTRGLYVTLVSALGAQPRFFKAEVMAQAQMLLAAEELERRRRVVLIVDEAHLLTPEQLEELRLLTNADMDATNPFALLMAGQPMLLRRLKMGSFAALDQRLSTRYQVQPLDLAEAVQYLRHVLAWAGRSEPLFADDAVARLHQASQGLARKLNNLARDALIAAAAAGNDLVDDACAKKAVAEHTAHEGGAALPVGLS